MESCPGQVWILLKVEPTELLREGTKTKNVAPRLVAGGGRGGVTVSEMGEGL